MIACSRARLLGYKKRSIDFQEKQGLRGMVVRASEHWRRMVYGIIVRSADLSLLGDYVVVGLGGGYDTLCEPMEGAIDVSGTGRCFKAWTGMYRGLRVSAIAAPGGGVYAEWVAGLAVDRGVKALIGVGWCGALREDVEVGDVVSAGYSSCSR